MRGRVNTHAEKNDSLNKTPIYYRSSKCCMCNKWTQHKPWDNDERKRRCAKCYEEYCHQEAELIHQKRNGQNMEDVHM